MMTYLSQYELFDLAGQPWVTTIACALLVTLLIVEGYRLLRPGLQRIAAAHTTSATVGRYIDRPVGTVLPLMGLQILWDAAGSDLRLIEAVRHVNSLALIAAITWFCIQLIRGFAEAVIVLNPLDIENNLAARRIHTQSRVVSRVLIGIVLLIGLAAILMSFPNIRQVGASLLASAGVAGLVAGIAARPVLANLIAGIQIALTQPIRLDDVVIVQGEWGWIEEIGGTYVVVRLWDQRRLVVPLQWFIENPFQNWTRSSSEIVGSLFLWVDYRMPLAPLRAELLRVCQAAAEWDRRVCLLQVTEAGERALQLRILLSSVDSPRNWDLKCLVREALVTFIQERFPQHLPTLRVAEGEG